MALPSLVAWQTGVFLTVEVSERAASGAGASAVRDIFHTYEIWLGLLLQLPVAHLARRLLGAVGDVAGGPWRAAAGVARPAAGSQTGPVGPAR